MDYNRKLNENGNVVFQISENMKTPRFRSIRVPDSYKMQKVKMLVMLAEGIEPSDALKRELLGYAKKHIAKYAMPYDIEFRSELPKALVGKAAYKVLEEEELKSGSGSING